MSDLQLRKLNQLFPNRHDLRADQADFGVMAKARVAQLCGLQRLKRVLSRCLAVRLRGSNESASRVPSKSFDREKHSRLILREEFKILRIVCLDSASRYQHRELAPSRCLNVRK